MPWMAGLLGTPPKQVVILAVVWRDNTSDLRYLMEPSDLGKIS